MRNEELTTNETRLSCESLSQETERQLKIILKGAASVVNEEDLRARLARSIRSGVPLTVKLGLDPSAPDIHLGHAVVLRKLKQKRSF